MTEDQTVMQNPTEPVENPVRDLFAELVQAVRQSLLPSPPVNPPTVPEEILLSAQRHLLPQTPAALAAAAAAASPIARPATSSGEAEDCSGFLLQVSLYF